MAKDELGIRLDSVEKVKRFSAAIGKIDGDMDLVKGRYTVDAKSIMGIFSLDLSKDLVLIIRSGDVEQIKQAVSEFLV